MFVAVSTDGSNDPAAGVVSGGSATTESGVAQKLVWCGTNENTDRPTQFGSTSLPTSRTTPLAA